MGDKEGPKALAEGPYLWNLTLFSLLFTPTGSVESLVLITDTRSFSYLRFAESRTA